MSLNYLFGLFIYKLYFQINETWQRVYKIYFLKQNLITCVDCRRFFYYYQKGFSDQGVCKLNRIIDKRFVEFFFCCFM